MKRYWILLGIILTIMTGCGQEASVTGTSTASSDDMSAVIINESVNYTEETWDTGITPGHRLLTDSFVITEDMLYYVNKGSEELLIQGVCAVSLKDKEQSARQILQYDSGQIEAIAVGQEMTGTSGITILGKDSVGVPYLVEYSGDGQLLWYSSYGEQLTESDQEQIVFRLVKDSEGHYFALSMENIWLFDDIGNYAGKIACPGKSYRDLCVNDEGAVYVTYQDDQSNRCILARVQYQGQKLSEDTRINFDGYMWTGENGTLLMRDNSAVYAYMLQQKQAVKLLELADYDLTGEQIKAVRRTAESEIFLVISEGINSDNPVLITRLYESMEEQRSGNDKQLITLLLPDVVLQMDQAMGAGEFSSLAAEFNRQSDEYTVVLEGIPLEDGTDIYAAVNTRLLARESADLIYLQEYTDVERYMKKGYLEDLIPYIEQSENIHREEYLDAVLRCFTVGNSLYSIPVSFSIDTLGGKISEMGETPGWTTEEFLNWRDQHPDAQAQEGLSKSNILTYCLMGGLDSYLDSESHQCYFDGEAFQTLLERINLLETDGNEHWEDWQQRIYSGECTVLDRYDVYSFLHCSDKEDAYGEKLVYKGYPSEDGSPCYFYSGTGLSILSRSSCKEGAYAFWEYYLLHHFLTPDAYYTDKELMENSMAYASEIQYAYDEQGRKMTRYQSDSLSGTDENAEQWLLYMSEEQCDKQLAMMENVRTDTLENQTIRNMILEEAQYYFQGIKGLDETCGIIQSRVQLYLTETK